MQSKYREEDRQNIKEWLARVLIKGTFGNSSDNLFPTLRKIINDNLGVFPLDSIKDYYKGTNKSISFSDYDIERLLDLEYGKAKSYSVLSLLYMSLNHNYQYHQDHIFPWAVFNKKKLLSLGVIGEGVMNEYLDCYNKIANLQLIEATSNIEKSDRLFKDWLYDMYPDELSRNNFLKLNYINLGCSLELTNFLDFYNDRKINIKKSLVNILG